MSRKRSRNSKARASIVHDVKTALDAIDMIGHSKKDARKEGIKGIHSLKQKSNSMSDCQNFVKWVRAEHGIRKLDHLTEQHYKAYFAYLEDKGISKGHMINVETSLRLLEHGHKMASKERESDFAGFCTENRLYVLERNESLQNRSYERWEIDAIKKQVSAEVSKAVDLMSQLGLRVKEAVNIRVEHFVAKNGGLQLNIPDKKGAGITKGGRFREVDVPNDFIESLQSFLTGKEPTDRLVAVSYDTVRKGVHTACKKAGIEQAGRGCHGFRHSYARDRFAQLASAEQKNMMDRILDNRSVGRKADYGMVSEHDKELYESTRAVMNQVHSELGHGNNRWRLAMVYLRE